MSINIAIDGPAGAGKSTIAKLVAEKRKYIYVDTGAMYRAMALYFIRKNISHDDEKSFENFCNEINIDIKYIDGIQQLYLNGENVSAYLRTEEVGNMASACSVNPRVRSKLTDIQRNIAKSNNVVMDGRDIGATVLPDANVKIFLTASVDVRAKRRFDEYTEKGMSADYELIKKDIAERDYRDTHRECSPLVKAEDAFLLDSSDLNIEQVLDKIESIIDNKLNKTV